MSNTTTVAAVWCIPLIKEEEEEEEQKALAIVAKNNMAVYAHVLLCGNEIEGE